jgi:hypothetical protein
VIRGAAEWLGLPPGWPDVLADVAAGRYALVAIATLWAALLARSRPVLSLLAGIAFVEAALGFWILAFGRPYGLFEDASATRRAAEISIAASTQASGESFIAGERAAASAWGLVARSGLLPPHLLTLLPTLLPLVVVPAVAALVHFLGTPRETAQLAALLWLAASSGDLDTLRGSGFVPGLWARPAASALLVVFVALVLAIGRSRTRPSWTTLLIAAAACGSLFLPAAGAPPGLADAILLLTLDQGPWIFLGLLGLRRRLAGRDEERPARPQAALRLDPRGEGSVARGLVIAGGLGVLACALLPHADPWASHAIYRLGLILSAAGPLDDLATRAGAALARPAWLRGHARDTRALGSALLLLLLAPGSFLAWWDPTRLDPLAKASLDPLPANLTAAMEWIRVQTPPDAVFLASPDYAPFVAVLGGRRLLRCPSLALAHDEAARVRAEAPILAGREPAAWTRPYRVRYVFIAPGDFRARGVKGPEDLEGRPRLRLRYADAHRFRVYEVALLE